MLKKEIDKLRRSYGVKGTLLTTGTDSKTVKGEKYGYMTFIMYLIPFKGFNGKSNLCPMATKGCADACLVTAGHGRFDRVKESRSNRTNMFINGRNDFFIALVDEIERGIKKAHKNNLVPVFRLNGTSDIQWEKFKVKNGKTVFELFPDVVFYDYTKIYPRFDRELPENYYLIYSYNEVHKEKRALEVLEKGGNVAVVFKNGLPETFLGRPVIDGDLSDLRFNDGKGVIIGLKAKGEAKKDTSGFVVDTLDLREEVKAA